MESQRIFYGMFQETQWNRIVLMENGILHLDVHAHWILKPTCTAKFNFRKCNLFRRHSDHHPDDI